MAKGRKLTNSRSERLLGTYSYGHSNGSNGMESSELGEDDVWSMVDSVAERVDHAENASNGDWNRSALAGGESNGSFPIRTRRRLPRDDDQQVGGLSLAFDDSGKTASSRIIHQFRGNDSVSSSPRGHLMATSAPVNVPDWSKILRVDSVDSLHDLDDGFNDYEPEMVPPHEFLARSRKPAATSVFEGVGRTLKGRDMSRVRDAVWRQTGFDG
ncbi:hypothetical protein UlMin_011290 [Ulmus minor]